MLLQGEVPLSVSGLLHSLGLGKYEIAFRAEEVSVVPLLLIVPRNCILISS